MLDARAGQESLVVFSPDALAHQHYEKEFPAVARDAMARGHTAEHFARKHPEVVSRLIGTTSAHAPMQSLTSRERDVLALMAEGHTNAGIARRLWVSDRTVETHVANILMKLGLDGTAEGHRRVLAVLTFLESTR